MDQVWQW